MVWTAAPEKRNHKTPTGKRTSDISALSPAYALGDFTTDSEESKIKETLNVHLPQLLLRRLCKNARPNPTQ